ncbi:Phytanoyl-CoA dioxygenase (PhyH) [Tistlia consotensis]|uniref:Phytanoyl-CoA dioxygenase (PhyH) n=1 Tax=Tistlia consotensis USBA 355 TaxID=560819 RepID=A0A1Y6CCI1_9PROT|nr:phytanoyl-CoA dioxygenase family protein [Tistlia consotensis]SMF47880.1 Phytanoyl-CoA dioxygenase (PhyH) [Tistlia consotensis USBA 355]SNR82132.1 Phytanoyl-CoA dioxygenase (PhyH) [Tistlia consotensis]
MLDEEQVRQFREEGYLIVPGCASTWEVVALNSELDGWIDESRQHSENWGVTADGKHVFDLEPGHSAERPKLRRVTNPADFSDLYRSVLFDGRVVDVAAGLLGPDVKFHHCKINIKMPSMETYVGWHQDHPFEPHTNDSVVVALVMLDDMTEQNGALQVVPGSHRTHYSHYKDERFAGEIDRALWPEFEAGSVKLTGKAGDVVFIDSWMVHGSPANRSDTPRRLLICDYTAADAFPLSPSNILSAYRGHLVRGRPTRMARLRAGAVELPPLYKESSFFAVQGQDGAQMSGLAESTGAMM